MPPKGQGRRRKNSDQESDEGKEQISYAVYESAANTFFKNGDYSKAIDNYTKALDLQPGNVSCLISRSKCYLELQDLTKALEDSDTVLKDDKQHIKGLLQKAEVLYFMGNFETSLVYYHRGNKLRPEIRDFRLGIQKTQEAINNSVGEDAGCQLHSDGDLSYFFDGQVQKNKKKGYNKPANRREERQEKRRPKSSNQNSKTVKELLGDLYADKVFLEDLLRDVETSGAKTETNDAIRELSIEGLDYLTTRTQFWQQQKPMYSRKRDKQMREGASSRASSAGNKRDRQRWVLKKLEEIDDAQADGAHERALKMAQRTLKDVERWDEEDLSNKSEIIASLHSCIGNSYLELGKYDLAIKHHNRDLDFATDNDMEDAKSRAMDNIGRVHARRGHFDKAIVVWEKKLPLAKSALEKTWLYHEIGRCYLEQTAYEMAMENGEKSLAAAQEASDDVWQLNATVLIAQSQVKLNQLQEALDSFERALEMARIQEDSLAQKAIKSALDDVNKKIVRGLKDSEEQEKRSRSPSPKGSHRSRSNSPKGGRKGSRSRSNSPKGGRKGSRSRSNSPKGGKKGSRSRSNSPKGGKKGSRSRSNSPKGGRKGSADSGRKQGSPKGGKKDSPKSSPRASPKAATPEKKSKEEERKVLKYQITTKTGDKMFSGTDADVFIIVYGEKGESQRIELKTEDNDFESGRTCEFEHQISDVGKIEKIHIGHNGENPGAGWYLDEVIVEVRSRSEKTTFICDRWLDKEEADGAIEIDLFPNSGDVGQVKS